MGAIATELLEALARDLAKLKAPPPLDPEARERREAAVKALARVEPELRARGGGLQIARNPDDDLTVAFDGEPIAELRAQDPTVGIRAAQAGPEFKLIARLRYAGEGQLAVIDPVQTRWEGVEDVIIRAVVDEVKNWMQRRQSRLPQGDPV